MCATTRFSLTLAVALLAAAALPVLAQPKALAPAQIVAAGSEISFVTRQMGVPVEGRFGKFMAQIALDPKKPETGSVAFVIDTDSARFGAAETDAEVRKAEWLAVAKYPQAMFRSSSIKSTGPGRYEVSGMLSIKGQSRPLVVPVQLAQAGATSTASGSFAIQRLAFKVGEGDWSDTSVVADDVQVRFKLALTGLAPM